MVTPTVDSKDTVSTRPVWLRRIVKNGLVMKEGSFDVTCFWRSWNRCIPGLSQQGIDVECYSNEIHDYDISNN